MSAQATLFEHADTCLAALDDAGRAIARRVFLRLISFRDGEVHALRKQPRSALQAGDDPEHVAAILRHLTQARLIKVEDGEVAAEPLVELADETVISWPTLQSWIRSHGKAEQSRRQLESEAADWQQRAAQGLADDALLDKRQLSELATWLTAEIRRDLRVSEAAESFIAASRAAVRPGMWPGKTAIGGVLAILLMMMLLATPIVLLMIVVLTARVIRFFG